MEIDDLAEITGGHESRKGITGTIKAIDGATVLFQPVNDADDWLTPRGEPFEINTGLLTQQPTPTDIRRAKRRFREDHIAKLRTPPVKPPPKIREFIIPKGRRRKSADY